MANNRMFIRCKGCGEVCRIATCGLDEYQCCFDGERMVKNLNEFFRDHFFCENPRVEAQYDERVYPMPDDFNGCQGAFDIVHEYADGTGMPDPDVGAELEGQNENLY